MEEDGQKDRERGREKREDLGVINQSTCPDSRQNASDIKVLSCQSCFTAYSTEEGVRWGRKTERKEKGKA